jgi:leucyl aminopeptidase (aminopeptidase T)
VCFYFENGHRKAAKAKEEREDDRTSFYNSSENARRTASISTGMLMQIQKLV